MTITPTNSMSSSYNSMERIFDFDEEILNKRTVKTENALEKSEEVLQFELEKEKKKGSD